MNTPHHPALVQLFEGASTAGVGLREQLCTSLRAAIRKGHLAFGTRLPSTRVLAQDLSLSRVTVEAAYGQLQAEGYLQRKIGDGSFVAIDIAPVSARTAPDTPRRTPALTAPVALSRRGQRMVGTGGCMEPLQLRAFAAGSPDLLAFPHKVWRQLSNRHLRTGAQGLMGYGDPQGHSALRDALADYLVASRGVRCSAEQVLVLTSSQQALQLLAMVLLDDGDVVWMEDPGYPGARTAFAATGARVVNLRVDEHGAVPSADLPVPRLIYLTPSHQFPTGHPLSLERRLALIAYAQRHGAWIVEDDYDSEFQYDGRPTPALQGLDHSGCVVYIGTFSKALFPSLRLAYTVLPAGLVQAMVIGRSIFDGHPAQLAQAVTADFMAQGHFAAHLRLMRQLYRSRRDTLLDALHQHLPWAQPLNSVGGLQISVRLPPRSEGALTRQAGARGIATPSLSALYHGDVKCDGWRLGFAALQPQAIVAAVQTLATLKPAGARGKG